MARPGVFAGRLPRPISDEVIHDLLCGFHRPIRAGESRRIEILARKRLVRSGGYEPPALVNAALPAVVACIVPIAKSSGAAWRALLVSIGPVRRFISMGKVGDGTIRHPIAKSMRLQMGEKCLPPERMPELIAFFRFQIARDCIGCVKVGIGPPDDVL